MTAQPIVIWTEIPVRNLEKAVSFYNAAFGWTMTISTDGPQPFAILGNEMGTVSGNLFEGEPATNGSGNRIHLAVTKPLDDAKADWIAAGGTVISDEFEIPYGKFVFAADIDGNTIGLFEANETPTS